MGESTKLMLQVIGAGIREAASLSGVTAWKRLHGLRRQLSQELDKFSENLVASGELVAKKETVKNKKTGKTTEKTVIKPRA